MVRIARRAKRMNYKTTKEVAEAENITRFLASVWARANKVSHWGRNYLWTEEDIERFRSRDKKRGPKFKEKV